MLRPSQIARLYNIQRILISYGLDEYFFSSAFARPVHYLFYLFPWNWFGSQREPIATRIRMALEKLGPIYIKFGQLLSTRRDLLPEDIIIELSKLQDRVPPFPGHIARAIVEAAYGRKLDEVFTTFDETALASASIAQVHAATLKDGGEYIVKVIRPDIERLIRRDMAILYWLAEQFERYFRGGRNLGITGVIREFENTLLAELDLMREAANASQLRRNFIDEPNFYVPAVNWELTRKNVLVMERVYGISVSDVAALRAAGIDLRWLAEYGVKIFFTQVFRDNFFHADMHPGNIFIQKTAEKTRVIVVDFGIMSSLTEFDQRYLAENFLAFLNHDYRKVALLHVESGWVPIGTRVDEFEFAIRTVCEPLLDKPLQEISFGDLLFRLFQTARKFNVEIMPQLILLQKTMVNIEGIGRQLAPDLNPWETARPQLEHWASENFGLRGMLKRMRVNLPLWISQLPELPTNAMDLLTQLTDNKLALELRSKDLKLLRDELKRYHRRTAGVILGAILLLCAAVILAITIQPALTIYGIPLAAWITLTLAVIVLGLAWKN